MTKWADHRAASDTETVKALLIVNGGGAIASLAFLPTVLDEPKYAALALAIVYSLFFFLLGMLGAVVHNILRGYCSKVWEAAKFSPTRCRVFGMTFRDPCVCVRSRLWMWSSAVWFLVAGTVMFFGARSALQ